MNNQPFQPGSFARSTTTNTIGMIKGVWWHEWAGAWQMSVITDAPYPELWWCDAAEAITLTDTPRQYSQVLLVDNDGYIRSATVLSVISDGLLVALDDKPDMDAVWVSSDHLYAAIGKVA